MFSSLLVFLLVLIAQSGGAREDFAQQIESSFDAIKLALNTKVNAGFKPENLRRSSATAKKLLDTTYSDTGFIYLNVYLDTATGSTANCSTSVSLVSGVSVDYCKAGDSYYYKYQVTKDSCEGAVVEYYEDADCASLLGTSDLGVYAGTCEPVYDTDKFDHVVHQALKCSTASSPVTPTNAFIKNYYVDTNCGRPIVAYDAYGAESCLAFRKTQKVYIDCSNEEEPKAKIYGSTCEGEAVSTTALSIDCANNLQDDDHYLGPYLDPPTSRDLASAAAEVSDLAAGRVAPLVASSISTRAKCQVSKEKDTKGLSKGILAAIIIGVIVGVALLVAFLYYKIFMEETPVLGVGTEMNHLTYFHEAESSPASPEPPARHVITHAAQGTQPMRGNPMAQYAMQPLHQPLKQASISSGNDSGSGSQRTQNQSEQNKRLVKKAQGMLSSKV